MQDAILLACCCKYLLLLLLSFRSLNPQEVSLWTAWGRDAAQRHLNASITPGTCGDLLLVQHCHALRFDQTLLM